MIGRRSDPEPLHIGGFATISDAVFQKFQTLIHREAGIWLGPHKSSLLAGRLAKRIRELKLASYRDYLHLVEQDELERTQMLDRISTNETHFFREPRHFEYLEQRVFPVWLSTGKPGSDGMRIRVWSAGCSSGEEPYTIAMSMLRVFRPEMGWKIEILATDLSTRVLEQARKGVWPIAKSDEIPIDYLRQYMLRGTQSRAGQMKAGPEARSVIKFARLNLNDEKLPEIGMFDLIFCRNVLIYFDAATKERVVRAILDRLVPWGHFFLGHSESLGTKFPALKPVIPTVYKWADPSDKKKGQAKPR